MYGCIIGSQPSTEGFEIVTKSFVVTVSNAAPKFLPDGQLDVYGGLGVVVCSMLKNRLGSDEEHYWVGFGTKEEVRYDGSLNVTVASYVPSSAEDYSVHYNLACKGTWWPVCHGLLGSSIIYPFSHFEDGKDQLLSAFHAHRRVQKELGERVAQLLQGKNNASVVVHDYQLTGIASQLRNAGVTTPIGYYHHVPFPSPADFWHLPFAAEILLDLLNFDALGFHTSQRDVNRFSALLDQAYKLGLISFERLTPQSIRLNDGRIVRYSKIPARIDPYEVKSVAKNAADCGFVRSVLEKAGGRKLILSGGRFDYTKGYFESLATLRYLLRTSPELAGEIYVFMNLQKTRYALSAYDTYQRKTLALAEELHASYPDTFGIWQSPVQRSELLGLAGRSDICLVTPLMDGQNLVAQEFVASQQEDKDPGVLVISKGAGFCEDLSDGLILNDPRDPEEHIRLLQEAISLPSDRRRSIHEQQWKVLAGYTSKEFGEDLLGLCKA